MSGQFCTLKMLFFRNKKCIQNLSFSWKGAEEIFFNRHHLQMFENWKLKLTRFVSAMHAMPCLCVGSLNFTSKLNDFIFLVDLHALRSYVQKVPRVQTLPIILDFHPNNSETINFVLCIELTLPIMSQNCKNIIYSNFIAKVWH